MRWLNPKLWPWIFDSWLALTLAGFARPVWRWLQGKRAESWPPAQGRIDSTAINEGKWFRTSHSAHMSRASFTYSYELGGKRYTGAYKKEFGTDEESDDFLRELEGKAITVQYDPNHPSRSIVLESSLERLQSSRAPNAASPLDVYRYWNPIPKWLAQFIPLFESLALVGFVFSLWVNLETAVFRATPSSYFMALHGGIFVVFIPAIIVMQKRAGSTNRRDFWKIALKGPPTWVRYVLYCVFAYGVAIWIPSWFRALQQASGGGHQNSGFGDWGGFSAAWMGFYWASFAILYGATAQDKLTPRCVNGHVVLPGSKFCVHCGQPVVHN